MRLFIQENLKLFKAVQINPNNFTMVVEISILSAVEAKLKSITGTGLLIGLVDGSNITVIGTAHCTQQQLNEAQGMRIASNSTCSLHFVGNHICRHPPKTSQIHQHISPPHTYTTTFLTCRSTSRYPACPSQTNRILFIFIFNPFIYQTAFSNHPCLCLLRLHYL